MSFECNATSKNVRRFVRHSVKLKLLQAYESEQEKTAISQVSTPRMTRTRTDHGPKLLLLRLALCGPAPPQVAQTLSSQRRISTPLSLHQIRSHSSDRSLSFTSSVLISPRLSRRSGSQHANQPQPRFPTLDSDELASKVREEVDGPMRIPM